MSLTEKLDAVLKASDRRWYDFRLAMASVLAIPLLTLLPGIASSVENLLGGAEPLSPQEAFVPSARAVTGDTLTIGFDIAEGYYLYRDKTSFKVEGVSPAGDSSAVSLGTARFPQALVVEDEFFGEQAVYRNSAEITLPYTVAAPLDALTIAVTYQGCADIGLCYPPTTVTVNVELPPPSSAVMTGNSGVVGNTPRIGDLLRDSNSPNQDDLLPPELAYLPQVLSARDDQLTVRWQIEPGYYLYRDKLSFTLLDAGGAQVVSADIDPGIDQYDEFFGNVQVLRISAEARLQLDSPGTPAQALDASLQINYQGCADIGVCFPPSVAVVPVAFDQTSSGNDTGAAAATTAESGGNLPTAPTPAEVNTAAPTADTDASTGQSEQDRLFSMLGSNSLWLNVATFFGLGLLLAFTPCVLPMVPILSSLIVGQGGSMSTGKAFRLSLVYVLVMASTYAVVGIIVGLSGYNVQAFLQNPWVLSSIALLFVVLSLSMFGFYELQMPAALQAKLTQWSNKQGGGEVTGVAAMGFISTLIVGPCVTAPLAGALIYIAKTGDALIGGAALFSLGLGMGAPLLLIGTSAGRLLPRAGAWMNATKAIFGILLLAMAVYMVSRFLPTPVIMGLYGILAVMSGVYLGATDTVNSESKGWQRFGKGAGLVVAIYGLSLLIGALAGGTSYYTPLRGFMSAGSVQGVSDVENDLAFSQIKGVEGLQKAVDEARRQGRPVMLDFYADWCISCKEMEAFTFTDRRVQALLADAVLVQADVTANDEKDQALLKQFDLFGPPGIIFYDATGRELPAARVVGFVNAEKFGNHIERFIGGLSI